jgi:hypothetical protein
MGHVQNGIQGMVIRYGHPTIKGIPYNACIGHHKSGEIYDINMVSYIISNCLMVVIH